MSYLVSDVHVADGYLQVAQDGVHDGLQPACWRWLPLRPCLVFALHQAQSISFKAAPGKL